jgi:hypothetical protein
MPLVPTTLSLQLPPLVRWMSCAASSVRASPEDSSTMPPGSVSSMIEPDFASRCADARKMPCAAQTRSRLRSRSCSISSAPRAASGAIREPGSTPRRRLRCHEDSTCLGTLAGTAASPVTKRSQASAVSRTACGSRPASGAASGQACVGPVGVRLEDIAVSCMARPRRSTSRLLFVTSIGRPPCIACPSEAASSRIVRQRQAPPQVGAGVEVRHVRSPAPARLTAPALR